VSCHTDETEAANQEGPALGLSHTDDKRSDTISLAGLSEKVDVARYTLCEEITIEVAGRIDQSEWLNTARQHRPSRLTSQKSK
jgi:hypothetical protein